MEELSEAVETSSWQRGFSPNLGWSHYRALMEVRNENERLFYGANPGLDEKELKFQYISYYYGEELADRVRRYLEDRSL